jgi:hypothetical protein
MANSKMPKNAKQPTSKGAHIMATIRPFAKSDTLSKASIEPLLLCPRCNIGMSLFGVETESDKRDLYTFECVACSSLEVRSVPRKALASVIIPITQ